MSLTTRAELIAGIQRWAQNADLDIEAYDDFIVMTETHLNTELRVQDMSERWYTDTVVEQPLYSLPADARGVRAVKLEAQSRSRSLHRHTPETLEAEYGLRRQAGIPEAYTFTGLDIEIQPVPNGVFPLEILYYRAIEPLTPANDVNWLLTKYPNIYLYGGLHFLAEYVRDDEASAYWGSRFGNAILAVTDADSTDRWSGGTPVIRAT